MKWVINSLCSAVLSCLWALSVKQGTKNENSEIYALKYNIITTIVIFFVYFHKRHHLDFSINIYTISAGIFQAIAMVYLTKSLQRSSNPGIVLSIFRSQAVLTAILAYFFFSSNLSPTKIIALITAVIGVYLTTIKNKKEGFNKQKSLSEEESGLSEEESGLSEEESGLLEEESGLSEEESGSVIKKKSKSESWIIYAIIAAICISFKDVSLKKRLIESNKLYKILFMSFIFQIMAQAIQIKYKYKKLDLNKKSWKMSTISGAIFALYAIVLTFATKQAPNVGYVKSISSLGVIFTLFISKYLYHTTLSIENISGVILQFASIAYISIAK